jgi:hypothetical protein
MLELAEIAFSALAIVQVPMIAKILAGLCIV